jgi:hypothetical protein
MQERKKDAETAVMHTEGKIEEHRLKRNLGFKRTFSQRKDGVKGKDQVRKDNLSLLTKRVEERNKKLEAKFKQAVWLPL